MDALCKGERDVLSVRRVWHEFSEVWRNRRQTLGLPQFAVDTAYASFESDELSDGLLEDDMVHAE